MTRDVVETERNALPIACNLSDPREARERMRVVEQILRDATSVNELEDGYEFVFPGDDEWAARLMQFVASERKCCPFFLFTLTFEQNCGPLRLGLRGATGVKDFIREWLASLSTPETLL